MNIVEFRYEYDPNSYNIGKQTYDHRTNDPCTEFSYDNLDRLTVAGYGIDESNEVFTMDDLGNRDMVNVRDGNDVNYVIDYLTNRYSKVGDANITYDQAGSLAVDKGGYGYEYDYENRIVEINDVNGTTVAEFAYDALGRRIRKIDSVASETTDYYYNDKWQVLCEYVDGAPRMFVYGNYIDEVLLMYTGAYIYYAHDHLYSPAALIFSGGVVLERYEYDAYGDCHVLEPNYADDPDGKPDYGNPYLFTGRRVDILDEGSLKIQYNRNRYYDYYTGRWTTHDPLGITPNAHKPNFFAVLSQYTDGLSLYQYVRANPVRYVDAHGAVKCKKECEPHWKPVPVPPWLRRPPRRGSGTVWFGVTKPCYRAYQCKLRLSSRGCEGPCRRIAIRKCECHVTGKYYDPSPRWMKDLSGRTPKQHEHHHGDIVEEWWPTLPRYMEILEMLPCMCIKRAKCFKDLFDNFLLPSIIKQCEADNFQFDCDVYEPSPEKRTACAAAATAQSQASLLFWTGFIKGLECLMM